LIFPGEEKTDPLKNMCDLFRRKCVYEIFLYFFKIYYDRRGRIRRKTCATTDPLRVHFDRKRDDRSAAEYVDLFRNCLYEIFLYCPFKVYFLTGEEKTDPLKNMCYLFRRNCRYEIFLNCPFKVYF
jgi:hypothetical protein